MGSSGDGFGFAHAFPFQVDAMGVVDEAIEDRIGNRRASDEIVPARYSA